MNELPVWSQLTHPSCKNNVEILLNLGRGQRSGTDSMVWSRTGLGCWIFTHNNGMDSGWMVVRMGSLVLWVGHYTVGGDVLQLSILLRNLSHKNITHPRRDLYL